ncbi:hypothetical protein [Notoacmeibacter marinus]|uniref:hypothetical protein n=1 Tax=Notoacmeibacter marinus TaxID=1876515 RepID=UPI000DF1D845|nr:hypothetical protein [Notoacmeibacter marinus]
MRGLSRFTAMARNTNDRDIQGRAGKRIMAENRNDRDKGETPKGRLTVQKPPPLAPDMDDLL